MKRLNRIIQILEISFILIFIVSCDYFTKGDGIVIDKIEKQPIDSVLVEGYLLDNSQSYFVGQQYTDSSGHFEIASGPLGSNKQDLILIFSKIGYHTVVVKEPKNEKIILKKNNNKREYLETIYRR